MSGLAIRPISTTEALVASIRAQILDGAIAPGARLPELELAATFGVARPTVRAAVQTLVHEGLLVREPNRSPHVLTLTRESVSDLFFVRIPVECFVVRQVMKRGASLDGAREAIDRLEALGNDARWSDVVDADLEFHSALAAAVGSPRLERLYGSMVGEIELCIAQLRPSWSTPEELGKEHHALLDVIANGSVDDAEARMTAHLERAVHDLTGLPPA